MTRFKPNHVFQFLFIIYLFMLPSLHCKEDPRYGECKQPFTCGNLTNISYPFWGGTDRPQVCGRVGFELTNCKDETQLPHIKIEELDFHVSNINSQELLHTMKIARSDLWDSPCTKLIVNTSLDDDRFSYVQTVRNLTLYYGCVPQNESVLNNFTCNIEETPNDIAYYVDDSLSSIVDISECFTNFRIPIFWEGFDTMPQNATAKVENVMRQGFQVEFSADWDLCRACLNSNGTCVSNATTDSFLCLCKDGLCDPTCPIVHGSKSSWKFKVVLGLCSVVGLILFFVIGFSVKHRISVYKEANSKDVEAFIQNIGPLAVKRYKFSAVRKITYSFRDTLGQGGYGDVYKGNLLNGCPVAVKVLKESKGNGEDFVNEVASISRTSHVNVVTLLGYCFEGKKKALIYEFMPNGSLEKFIYKDNNPLTNPHLELEKLFQIAIGIARGLEYLHRGCNTRILHFDIKPHNILLDENFSPKISDFGLSKLCTRKESMISMLDARGTIGYIAPEIFSRNFGRVSAKSDVYSYGMMILEMVGGRKNIDARVSHSSSEIYFPDWVYEHLEQGSNFGLINAVTEEEKEIARKMILVGMWCIQTRPSDRPSMSKVIEMLEGSIGALQIPPKPVLSSPVRSSPPESTALSTLI